MKTINLAVLRVCIFIISLLYFLAAISAPPTVLAQDAQGWQDPVLLFPAGPYKVSTEIVSDSSGTLHIFIGTTSLEDEVGTIYYVALKGDQLTYYTDILVAPDRGSSARVDQVVMDDQGWIHLVWTGSSGIFHTKAHVSLASSPHAWTTQKISVAQRECTSGLLLLFEIKSKVN